MSVNIPSKWEKPKIALSEIIISSSLSKERKDVWNVFIDAATGQEIIPILDALASDEDALLFLTENLTDKIAATKIRDKSVWSAVIQKEKEYIRKAR